jgi:hypothetical protein
MVREHFTPRMRPPRLPDNADPRLVRVVEEIVELQDVYERNGDARALRAVQWARAGDGLALVAAVLAATAGIVGLAWNSRIVAAVLALVAAVVAAVIATFQPATRTSRCKASAAEHWRVSAAARDVVNRLPEMRIEEARTELERLRGSTLRLPGERGLVEGDRAE